MPAMPCTGATPAKTNSRPAASIAPSDTAGPHPPAPRTPELYPPKDIELHLSHSASHQ